MNNAPLTFILIASLGIVAVISLVVFFAVRPKFADTDERLAADFALESGKAHTTGFPLSTHGRTTISQQPREKSAVTSPLIPVTFQNNAAVFPPGQSSIGPPSFGISQPGTGSKGPTFGQSSKQRGDQEIVSTVELLDPLRVAPGFGGEQDVRATARFAFGSSSSLPPSSVEKIVKPAIGIRPLNLIKELDMHRYGKVVGIAHRKGRLYVPSYQNGNISIYKADTLALLKEFSCGGCHIYDVGVFANGDMILSQGKYSKLTRLNGKDGSIVKEIIVSYSTKGIAVSPYDEIFVLPRDHDSIYVYDADLNQLAILALQNQEKADCNFLAYGADVIYVSCETATYVVDVQGKLVQTLKPAQGATYAIGVAVNSDLDGHVYIGQRGTSVLDVYDKNGTFVESIGEKKDTLWSDIAIGGKYLYVIEYITATIKQYKLR